MKKKRYFLILLSITGVITISYSLFIFAQEEMTRISERQLKKQSKEQCLNEFDIDKIDWKNPKAKINLYLLRDYFLCRAAFKDNIKECDMLISPEREVCRNAFNGFHGLFGSLLIEGRITPQILSTWKSQLVLDDKITEALMEGWLKKDISVCKGMPPDCRAWISEDLHPCDSLKQGRELCREMVNYIKAIRRKDIKACEKIKRHPVRMLCRGYIAYINLDLEICEDNKGFKEFCERYCE